MNALPPIAIAVAAVFLIILALATILMPLYVIAISNRVRKIDATLKKMEHLMRYGR